MGVLWIAFDIGYVLEDSHRAHVPPWRSLLFSRVQIEANLGVQQFRVSMAGQHLSLSEILKPHEDIIRVPVTRTRQSSNKGSHQVSDRWPHDSNEEAPELNWEDNVLGVTCRLLTQTLDYHSSSVYI